MKKEFQVKYHIRITHMKEESKDIILLQIIIFIWKEIIKEDNWNNVFLKLENRLNNFIRIFK